MVSVLSSLVPIEQSQAQLYVDIYPSQEFANGTLYIFGGWSSSIRTSRGNNASSKTLPETLTLSSYPDQVMASKDCPPSQIHGHQSQQRLQIPSRQLTLALPPLLIPASTSSPPPPTMTVGANYQTITHLYFRDSTLDYFGTRVSSTLSCSQNDVGSWTDAGPLANELISVSPPVILNPRKNDNRRYFLRDTTDLYPASELYSLASSHHDHLRTGRIRLGFLLFRRRRMQRKHQASAGNFLVSNLRSQKRS